MENEQFYLVEEKDLGARLDQVAAEAFSLSRAAVQKLLSEEALFVNGELKDKKYKVKEGDEISLFLPELKEAEALPEDLPLEIVYEDEDLAVVNKPKGMVVHPAPGNPTGTLVNALLFHLKNLSGINGVLRPGIVHRIDKNTSGLLMVAKNDESHRDLALQIKEHSFLRRYEALIIGRLKEQEGTINAPIGRHPVHRQKMAVVENGRPAITHYRVLEEFSGFSHVELTLETGRTHQIRVHMAYLGHPLMGDTLYGGGKTAFEKQHHQYIEEQCLHARDLGFVHPRTKKYMEFTSAPPPYFQKLLELLEKRE